MVISSDMLRGARGRGKSVQLLAKDRREIALIDLVRLMPVDDLEGVHEVLDAFVAHVCRRRKHK